MLENVVVIQANDKSHSAGFDPMVIHLSEDLKAALLEASRTSGVSPEDLALSAIRERYAKPRPKLEPRDDWERELLAIGIDCGVSLSDLAVSSEGIYE